MKKLAFLGCWILLLASILAVDSKSDGLGEWHILTKQNFSSQIRLHPHILLIVTLPWSGESRSFMKDVARLVTDRPEEFSSLKLMLIQETQRSVVVEAIGATTDAEETTVLYYHHSVSYKYRGRLRAQNVLSSLRTYVSIEPEELPFKSLTTPEDLKAFLDSTDKALLLFEFCEWSSKLLAKRKMNGTDRSGFGVQGDPIGLNFSVEANRSPPHLGKNNQKGMETANTTCGVDYGLDGVPWLGGFSSVNDSASLERSEKMSPGVASFCTRKEYQLFDSFFSKFMTVAREFFLPPERHKFGLVSERSMLSHLGVEDSGSWLAVLYFSGCPSCSKMIKKEDDLKNALQMDHLVVTELEGDGNTLEPAFPANQPSVLLFVDRSSELSETRIKSKEALDAFRELALHYLVSQQFDGQHEDKSETSKVEDYHALRSKSGHPKLKLSQAAQMIKLKDKMSNFMIVNEGKQVTLDKISLDLQGSSLKEILDIVLKQKKKAKLSSLAKELGFQLLSDDMDIKLVNTLPVRTEVQSDQHTQELSKEATITSSVDSDKDQFPQGTSISAEEHVEISEVTGSEISFQNDEEKTAYVDTSMQFLSVDSEQNLADHKLDTAEDLKVEEEISSQVDKSGEQQLHFQGFKGSFFFSDGNDRLLHALTGGSKVPALVIVDPIAAQHHVLSEETNLSYSSLADFLAEFVNGSLLPYQQSESVLHRSREATQPPFVNLDFHQVDTIPQVTSRTFSELVIGFNQSDTDAWNKDVLVLFSNRWCGFCQRMELVVHEVYRAMKDYVKMLKSGSKNEKTMFDDGDLKDEMLKLPFIYLLDCTLNDCSLILKSMNQREVYPALVLFPAEKKNVLPYEGDMAVTEIFKFMADHGSNSHHLISEKGILWTVAKKRGRNQNFFKVQLSDIHKEGPIEKDTLHEVLLTKTHKQVIRDDQAKSHTSQGFNEAALRVVTGSILVATDKLTVHPFDKSEILIVKADQVTGFQGLIINKHIRWDALNELEQGLEMLAEAPLSFGGPLIKGGMPLVALTRRFVKTEYPEVIQGVFFLDQLATIQKIKELKSGNQSVSEYWFFFGYSSWGWDQLFDEIAEGAWNLSDDGLKHLGWPLG
ncbi:uncharacterized protein Pyn_12588 [Prunus yedoensis var. nudiflora]|uniref:Thioredoxin domain-containing protein n=1 Tax=Prunus yedoensis var. nudiflora TaxID=2094558 RepID=A0A314ZJK2_PRUYE|nr:uncharacterized protein Pyn_12588 [Prunus yedoensis var. nudiflora]